MLTSDRIIVKSKNKNKSEIGEESSNNISYSSNNSFYEKLDIETKRDIIFLIKSGYNKKIIIKLYILIKPSNIEEAVNYLTKENGIYQHIFYNSPNDNEYCEICGEKKETHMNNTNTSLSISFNSININSNPNKESKINTIKIINVRNKIETEYKCKICEEDISEEEKAKNKCEQCDNYFCSECLYMHIKELIRNGKYSLYCPECSFAYTKNRIGQILSFNIKDKNEVENLKKLFEKSNTKELILSNPELMFCPIANCNGFAKKNKNKEYNICTMGHKFCIKCGELWHENGICKDEEKVDELFEKYRKQYNLKNCPYCNIITNKNGGCNHITCKYCGKDWCWICCEIFTSTEEHYGNKNNRCFGRMQEDVNVIICSLCENQIFQNSNFRTFSCEHMICRNCYIEYLLRSRTMLIFPSKLLNCIKPGCKGYRIVYYIKFIDFIEKTENERLIKKYRPSILILEYGILPFFAKQFMKLLDIYGCILEFFGRLYERCGLCNKLDCIFKIIGWFLFGLFLPVFFILVPIFFHLSIRDLYYFKFLPEIKKQNYNKIFYFIIIAGEEILALVFLFPLIIWHYIYTALFFPILFLVILIRNLIYGVPICR